MMVAQPLCFGVVIPAHNALPLVLDAIESALAQTMPPAEVIVVDDRSTDGTTAAVEALRLAGRPVRVVRGSFGGAAAARNAGWRAASSPWIAFLDADDVWLPDKLAVAAEMLTAAPRAAWFFSDAAQQDLDGSALPSLFTSYAAVPERYVGQPFAELLQVNFIATPSTVVRRDALEALGGFDESMSHAEDRDLWIRLARRWPAAASTRALVHVRRREGSLSQQVGSRLMGDVQLFEKLANDDALTPGLRRLALRSRSMAHFKLAFAALRAGDGASTRLHLKSAWLFPERALPVAGAWLASLLPAAARKIMRRQRWAARGLVAPTLRTRRLHLLSEVKD
jgi:glycosyltransferase involved in cell wall biosynthesis